MNLDFFSRSQEDKTTIFKETAAKRGLNLPMVEKDFWVSWTLAVLFGSSKFRDHLVFKGGTSLSKVFSVIARFSEDIDLSISPELLGISESSLNENMSNRKRGERVKELETACIECVREQFLPELEKLALNALGKRIGSEPWMEFRVDETTDSPVVLFHYPTTGLIEFKYLPRYVKMEFGSLTDQRPVGNHSVKPWVAEEFPKLLGDFRCNLVALELERTFWEKATILHAEHHHDQKKPMRDRFSRHYSDMAALSRHAGAEKALARDELRQRVADWKSRFFASGWAHYELAKPGTFRLVPPEFRLPELKADYQQMRDMFIGTPATFDSILFDLTELERKINK